MAARAAARRWKFEETDSQWEFSTISTARILYHYSSQQFDTGSPKALVLGHSEKHTVECRTCSKMCTDSIDFDHQGHPCILYPPASPERCRKVDEVKDCGTDGLFW